MPRRRRARRPSPWATLVFLAILAGVAAYRLWEQAGAPHNPSGTAGPAGLVTRVIDGDTIEAAGFGRIRLIGVDTPERGRPGFREATDRTRELTEGQVVTVEVCPVKATDRYGRVRALIYLPDGTLLNTRLLEEGFARVYTVPPCHVDAGEWLPLEADARGAGRGMWR